MCWFTRSVQVISGSRRLTLLSRLARSSVQVLNEFVAVARKKRDNSWPDILRMLDAFRKLLDEPRPITFDAHLHAVEISQEFGTTSTTP